MGRADVRSAILAFACLPGVASAAEFTAKNCLGMQVDLLAYNDTDTVRIVPATWVTLGQAETKDIKCATPACTLVLSRVGASLQLSENYSSNICLVLDSVNNPSATATMAYDCQPDRCK